jgi:hypothetical protein
MAKAETGAVKAELRAVKNSRVWRLYESIRPVIVGAKHLSSVFRSGDRGKAETGDGSN